MRTPLLAALTVPAALAAASVAGADAGDAARLKQFAAHARGAGTLTLTATYAGDTETCGEHDTCGVRGTARARLRLDRSRPVRVAGDVIVVPVTGSVRATVRDTAAGHVCRGAARLRSAGL